MSDFGKGLTYCLGMFLAHEQDQISDARNDYTMWFAAASDHLIDLQTSGDLTAELKKRLQELRDKSLEWRRLGTVATKEDKLWAIGEAKNLLIEIDKLLGVETEKGEWE